MKIHAYKMSLYISGHYILVFVFLFMLLFILVALVRWEFELSLLQH
jgi:hypothetical protein